MPSTVSVVTEDIGDLTNIVGVTAVAVSTLTNWRSVLADVDNLIPRPFSELPDVMSILAHIVSMYTHNSSMIPIAFTDRHQYLIALPNKDSNATDNSGTLLTISVILLTTSVDLLKLLVSLLTMLASLLNMGA